MSALLRDKRLPVWLLAAASVIAVPLLIRLQRDSGIWQDEWTFLLWRDGWSPADIFGAFNGQLLPLTPIVFNIDRALFSAGATGLLTFVSIVAQIAVAWAAFAYVRVRLGDWIAAACSLLLLFNGTGYELLVWNFNFGWMTALAAGVFALVVFESGESTKHNVGAVALLLLSMSGNNNSVVFIAAILVYALYKETRRRALLVAGPPFALFVLWYLVEGRGDRTFLPRTWPDWIAQVIESTFAGLLGDIGGINQWGTPLAVLGIGVMVYLLARERTIRPQLAVALSMPIIFIALITLGRGGLFDAGASRYRYTLLLFGGLALAELLRGQRLRTIGATIGFAGILGVFILSNLVLLPDGAASIRRGFDFNRVYATALVKAGPEVARSTAYKPVDPALRPDLNDDVYEWLVNGDGEKFAWTPGQLAAQPAAVQEQVQMLLTQIRKSQPVDASP
ncbi:MAG: hypothetical protein ACRDKE_06160 [Solirubrobacterales bacterium]